VRLDPGGQPIGEPITIRHPEDWPQVCGSAGGAAELTRHFHSPTNLDRDEAVFVVLTGVRGRGEIRLNGQLIGRFSEDDHAVECRLPLPLASTNALLVAITFAALTPEAPQSGLYGTVALEIRSESADDGVG
jgi:hypothetical protein